MTPRRAFTLAAFLLASSVAAAEDWPQWRGPNRDDVSAEKNLLKSWPSGGPPLVWTADLKGVGYGSPAVAGGKVFILGATDDKEGTGEFALCLDAADGKQVWRTPLPVAPGKYSQGWGSGPRGTPTVDGDTAYVLGAGRSGRVKREGRQAALERQPRQGLRRENPELGLQRIGPHRRR